jgi:hypothetical protein
MPEIECPYFRDRVQGCPQIHRRLIRALRALVNLQLEMTTLGDMARWLGEQAAPPAEASAPSDRGS